MSIEFPSEKTNKRELGFIESCFALKNDLFSGHDTISTLSKIKGEIKTDKFRHIFRGLFCKHPVLASTIIKENDNYYIERNADFENIEIIKHTTKISDPTLIFNKSFSKLDTSVNLWRVEFYPSEEGEFFYIIFTISHAISDGLSVANLIKEFLKDANLLSTSKNINKSKECLPFLLPIDSALNKESADKRFREETNIIEDVYKIPYDCINPEIKTRSTGNFLVKLDSEVYFQIKSKIATYNKNSNQKLSVHDVISGAFIKSIYNSFDNINNNSKIQINTPISLRAFSKPKQPLNNIGCSIDMIKTLLTMSDIQTIWTLSSYYKKLLNERINLGFTIPDTLSIEQIKAYLNNEKDKNFFEKGFGITNLGNFRFGTKDYNNFHLEEFYFGGSRVNADYVLILCITIYNNSIYLNFNHTEKLISHLVIENISKNVVKELTNISII